MFWGETNMTIWKNIVRLHKTRWRLVCSLQWHSRVAHKSDVFVFEMLFAWFLCHPLVTSKWLETLIVYGGLYVVQPISQLRHVMWLLTLPFWRIVLLRWPATQSSNYPSISLPPPAAAAPPNESRVDEGWFQAIGLSLAASKITNCVAVPGA